MDYVPCLDLDLFCFVFVLYFVRTEQYSGEEISTCIVIILVLTL